MPAGMKVVGTDAFQRVARELHAAGRGDLAREMTKGMRLAAEPVKQEMQTAVQALRTSTTRGGASARAARSTHALRNRKKLTERAKQKAHRQSGLLSTTARIVRATATASGRSASVRIRTHKTLMPADQRKLPWHLNRGEWRHPIFGGDRWVTQKVQPGWFDRPAKRGGPRVREEAYRVVIRTIQKLGS